MRWLLLKDLQILRRSPLLVALLILYPIIIAVIAVPAMGVGIYLAATGRGVPSRPPGPGTSTGAATEE